MRLPKVAQRVEAAKKEDKHRRLTNPAGISKTPTKKKRADKLRALAGAFTVEAQKAPQAPQAPPVNVFPLKYDIHEQIGQGKNGVTVSRCTDRASGLSHAVKCVPLALLGKTIGDERPAIATLAQGSQLVATHEILEGPDVLYHVMEYAAGGDLFEFLSKTGRCNETLARALFQGILAGIQQVHRTGQIHRDIKLENILLMHPQPTSPEQVRLADFEFCTPSPAQGPVGSLPYSAPEALDHTAQYGAGVDLWAAGVVLYAMLSAAAPFDQPAGADATAQCIRNARPGMEFLEPCWSTISPAAKDLVNGLLHPDPNRRLTMEAAILHPWLAGNSEVLTAKPKFALRCTWHTKAKRWSNQATAESASGGQEQVQMLVDDDITPLVACPLEWQHARCRANSV